MSDIRKWFMKQHDKGNGHSTSSAKPSQTATPEKPSPTASKMAKQPVGEGLGTTGRRKTSKYFAANFTESTEKEKLSDDRKPEKAQAKRKFESDDNDDDFVPFNDRKRSQEKSPAKKLKSAKTVTENSGDADGEGDVGEIDETPVKGRGRGGGRGTRAGSTGGRGRGGGRGGFMNFGERKDPPHKGEKEVPEGAPDCLQGLTFVISGTLDSLEREEAEDLIKRHGGRVTGSVSKKTNYLLADEDIGGRKSSKAKELGTTILTEDGLFQMICASKPAKHAKAVQEVPKKITDTTDIVSKCRQDKVETKSNYDQGGKSVPAKTPAKVSYSPAKLKGRGGIQDSLPWTEKYKPKVPNDIVGNQSLVKQLHDWLAHWHEQFMHAGQKGKGKKQSDSGSKKAVLLSGSPGIGKTTSAKLVSQMLGFQIIEVNASDSRGKADSKVAKGVGGNMSNSVKELVNNEALSISMDRSKHPKAVLIMDEVDGMSAGDRGGVADLIASIKISKIPIICICNDRYSQKLKSLVNYCLPLNYRKPTKQQMAKRLMQVASAEGLKVNEVALEELADRVNGDIRMALNQLQYMGLSLSVISYDDVRQRLLTSAKDEDISPFTAVDKLFGYDGGKLRMDVRIDLSTCDPDLVPLIIQENYINYRPSSAGKDDGGVKRMNLIAHAAESIADGDIVNVQIRRYRQWQLFQSGSFASCIVPAALMHGQREILEQGERNFNRFGGWLGKNSTMGKNLRLLDDVHVHILASQESNVDRATLRVDYFTVLLKRLTEPLRELAKDYAVQKVVEFMDAYSLSQEDFDTIVELSKFQGHPNPLEGIAPAVKAALTKAYKQGSSSRVVRAADLITLPGLKKAPKKRIAAILEPVDEGPPQENEEALGGSEEEESSGAEDADALAAGDRKPELDLQTNKSKGIQVQLDLKNTGTPSTRKSTSAKPRGTGSAERGRGRGSGPAKRKR